MIFSITTHLSEILEKSNQTPVIIFKYSKTCGTSSRLKEEIENYLKGKDGVPLIYLLTVQDQRVLSDKIEEYFQIKHESPQIIKIKDSKPIYHQNHFKIKIKDFLND